MNQMYLLFAIHLLTLQWFLLQAIPESQFQALEDFYNATNGDNWIVPWNFTNLNATNFCGNNNSQPLSGVYCRNFKVEWISFQSSNNINGTIPESFGNLTDLTILYFLNQPNLRGIVPDVVFTQLTNLVRVMFYKVGLNGSISDSIGNWKSLQAITIQHTYFSDTLPVSIYNLTNLSQISIYNNSYLSVEINQNLCDLVNLQSVTLSINNKLSGTFPGDCLSNFTKLETLVLNVPASNNDNNQSDILTGTLNGDTLSQLKSLQYLTITNTNINGDILSFNNYANLGNVTFFSIGNNRFSGTINDAICDSSILITPWTYTISIFAFTVHFFDINNNEFSGTIPKCFWDRIFNTAPSTASFITIIYLSNNLLTGSIGYDDIETCSTNNMNISCYGLLSFDASSNKFSGTLSRTLPRIPSSVFSVENNDLYGNLPHGWNILSLGLSNNKFNGHLYDNFINSTFLASSTKEVFIGVNKLEGSIPSGLINTPGLGVFSAGYNNFNRLPLNMHNPTLTALYLHNNDIIEYDIGNYLNNLIVNNTALNTISFRYNDGITGDLSKFALNSNDTTRLSHIWLDNCNIYGTLSPKMKINNTNNNLQVLSLYSNHLSCNLPKYYVVGNSINTSLVVPGAMYTKDENVGWINKDFDSNINNI